MKQPVDTTPYSFRLSRNPYGRLVLRSGRSACSVSNASAVRRAFWTMFFRILTAEANSSYDGKAKGTGAGQHGQHNFLFEIVGVFGI